MIWDIILHLRSRLSHHFHIKITLVIISFPRRCNKYYLEKENTSVTLLIYFIFDYDSKKFDSQRIGLKYRYQKVLSRRFYLLERKLFIVDAKMQLARVREIIRLIFIICLRFILSSIEWMGWSIYDTYEIAETYAYHCKYHGRIKGNGRSHSLRGLNDVMSPAGINRRVKSW